MSSFRPTIVEATLYTEPSNELDSTSYQAVENSLK